MKRNLSAVAILLLLATGARADEATTSSDKVNNPEDCSKPVWPNFTPLCLRNAGQQATNVRLVSTDRR